MGEIRLKKIATAIVIPIMFLVGCSRETKEIQIVDKYEIDSASIQRGSANPTRFFYTKDDNEYYIEKVEIHVNIGDKSEIHLEQNHSGDERFAIYLTQQDYDDLYVD